ncbi:hypothetical protein [Escherichia coli]|uniref:hypothetical protein n=1 Tax=Escherichia coli TaxID=562 RepID=UPI0037DC4820
MTTKYIDMGGWFKCVADAPVTPKVKPSAPVQQKMTVEQAKVVLANLRKIEEKKQMQDKQTWFNSPDFLAIVKDEISKGTK